MTNRNHHVVIVGGGFGGVKAALELSKDPRFDITLISDQTNMRYYPTIFRTATGGRKFISSMHLKEIFKDTKIKLVHDKVTGIDHANNTLITAEKTVYEYNAVILALGVQTNYFGIKGLKEYSYGIKTLDEAEEFKQHLHKQLIDDKKPDLNYVVIGGGPTGIELAGALPEYLDKISQQHGISNKNIHIDLVEAAPRLVPRMPKDISRSITRRLLRLDVKLYLNTKVQAETADALMINNKPLRSHTVIWTAGVTNHSFFEKHGFQIAPNHKVRVDQYLETSPGVYVIGDNADTPYSGMAQTAIHDGAFVAKNLIRLADNKDPRPYVAKKPIYVIPVGSHWAAVLWGTLRLYGWPGYMLRRSGDLVGYHDYEPWVPASKRWMADNDSEETCPTCVAASKQ